LRPHIAAAQDWGTCIRLACSLARFWEFQRRIQALFGPHDDAPALTLYGSGDFHHVTLALLRRLTTPFNLLVLDKHPDWMRGVPVMHCGTWLAHALRLPTLRRVFHVGGDLDFDNAYRWLAPWSDLRSGRIVVVPAVRRFTRGCWATVAHEPLRPQLEIPTTPERLDELLAAYRDELARVPLYITIDKDVLMSADAVVNWDSGHLTCREAQYVIAAFVDAAQGRLAGADLVGDWSPVRVRGWFRRLLHWTEHISQSVDADHAARRNEETNLTLIAAMRPTPAALLSVP
jgi:arginase family enzyme